jgi:hypothetical protein
MHQDPKERAPILRDADNSEPYEKNTEFIFVVKKPITDSQHNLRHIHCLILDLRENAPD